MKIYSNYASLKRALRFYFSKPEATFSNGWIKVTCPCFSRFDELYQNFLKKTDLYSCVRPYVSEGDNYVFYISSNVLK